MNEQLCQTCGNSMKFVPGGVNKNGRPYTSFFTCDVCNPYPPKNQKPQLNARPTTARLSPQVPAEVWDAKDRLQAAMAALKDAAIVSEGSGKSAQEIEVIADSHYAWLMRKRGTGEVTRPQPQNEDALDQARERFNGLREPF